VSIDSPQVEQRLTELMRSIGAVRRGPDALFEIRALGIKARYGRPFNASGYFRSPIKAARCILEYEQQAAEGIYITANEPDPRCHARSPDRMTDHLETTTSDNDIVRRWCLPIDCDPDRPRGVCATEPEVKAAMEFADQCDAMLREEFGWPRMMAATSGNGAYLLPAIDLPNDEETKKLLETTLKALNHLMRERWADRKPAVHVDVTMFNAARVIRMMGSRNAKGYDTEEQPHRFSRLLTVPDPLVVVTREQLLAVADRLPKAEPPRNGHHANGTGNGSANGAGEYKHRLDVPKWLQARGVGFSTKPGLDTYGRAVHLLAQCPFDNGHGGHKEVAIFQDPATGKLGASCKHNSCQGKGWQEFKVAIGKPDGDHYDPPMEPKKSKAKGKGRQTPQELPPGQFACTDIGNGERLAHRHGKDVRHCWPWGKWLVWTGTHWQEDNTGEIPRRAKQTVRSIYAEAAAADKPEDRERLARHAVDSEAAPRINAMVERARSEPNIPVLPAHLDTDPWLLNCVNGTLDLRSGQLREHRHGDYITRLCPTPFLPDAGRLAWQRFLDSIFVSDAELIVFIQRLFGFCLTGSVRENILPIFWGNGANGKTTIIKVILAMLGHDYAMRAAPGLLMAKRNETHPTERADLFGKRFVVDSETSEGHRLNEALIKDLTGGETIKARRMREDFWEFEPTHKVFLCTNHKPRVTGTDNGMWRRLRLVPFGVTFWNPDEPSDTERPAHLRQDKGLLNKLLAELPGVLAWCVEGCLDWQREGLTLPKKVQAATKEYRNSEDIIATFLAENCLTGPNYSCRAGRLHVRYRAYCERSGEEAVSRRAFGEAMTEKGFKRYTSNGVWYAGVTLAGEDDDPE
jgi:P4 family phage/plasmid primase-like protien